MTISRVLMVEDEKEIVQIVEIALQSCGEFKVVAAATMKEAVELLQQQQFDVIISDLNLPDSSGAATIMVLQRMASKLPLIVLTGGNSCNYTEAIQLGAQDYLVKGDMSLKELIRVIRAAIERHKVRGLFQPIEHEIAQAQETLTGFQNLVKKDM
jgi:DNA-binding response OmpR family regulator